jgi:hypothetical protein
MADRTTAQNYPRIHSESSEYNGFLDESKLNPHIHKFAVDELKKIIRQAIDFANKKSSRAILNIPDEASSEVISGIYRNEGRELFKYFVKYCGDPASTAHECLYRHYSQIAVEQFRNRTLQKERMNSGWRYQFIAKDSAILSKRFQSVSDIGASEADFNAIIGKKDTNDPINIYVSVKNRTNTMGGQDWPKAIRALEQMAKSDKNRNGPYICVFGIAMEKGLRNIKNEAKSKIPYSFNTEIWMSDFFWPFFSNYKYDEIVINVLDVLIEEGETSLLDIEIPKELIDSFGNVCDHLGLLDTQGKFNDPYKLVDIFCNKIDWVRKK